MEVDAWSIGAGSTVTRTKEWFPGDLGPENLVIYCPGNDTGGRYPPFDAKIGNQWIF